MALTPQTNDAFIREVDDELRRDRLESFGKRWGLAILAAVIVALAAFGGWMYWQHSQREAEGETAEAFAGALDRLANGDRTAATKTLADIAAGDAGGYRALARITQADLALEKNELKQAASLFGQVAADADAPQALRDAALVRQTVAEFDTLPPAQVIARLRGLAVPGNPWFGSAGEMVAIAHLRAGRAREAAAMFGQIARDEKVPESLRSRAVQLAGILGEDAVDQARVAGEQNGQTR